VLYDYVLVRFDDLAILYKVRGYITRVRMDNKCFLFQ